MHEEDKGKGYCSVQLSHLVRRTVVSIDSELRLSTPHGDLTERNKKNVIEK